MSDFPPEIVEAVADILAGLGLDIPSHSQKTRGDFAGNAQKILDAISDLVVPKPEYEQALLIQRSRLVSPFWRDSATLRLKIIRELEQRIRELEQQLEDRKRAFPDVIALEAEVGELKRQLEDSVPVVWDGELSAIWVCNLCGQPLPPNERCNSGVHNGPNDHEPLGKAILSTRLAERLKDSIPRFELQEERRSKSSLESPQWEKMPERRFCTDWERVDK